MTALASAPAAQRLPRVSPDRLQAARSQAEQLSEIVTGMRALGEQMGGALRGSASTVEAARNSAGVLTAPTSELSERTAAQIQQLLTSFLAVLRQRTVNGLTDLATLDGLAGNVRMLGLQASIEAGSNQRDGDGFAVVASDVRRLASRILQTSQAVTKALDDVAMGQYAARFQNGISQVLTELGELASWCSAEVDANLDSAANRLPELAGHLTVMPTLAGTVQDGASRLTQSVDHALARAGQLSDLRAGTASAGAAVAAAGLRRPDTGDRLDRVRAAGRLRIAVEPSFIGVSFVPPGQRALTGLDIEYATAYADWLGVTPEFVTYPWDSCPELLQAGRAIGEPEVDLVWSALPAGSGYGVPMAFSQPYVYLPFVLARRTGDAGITSLADLGDRVLGCINDPTAMGVLTRKGVRWAANADRPGGRVRLANLIAYSDQSQIHDCLVRGDVDAFVVDLPIYHWAVTDPNSPWKGLLEILPANLDDALWSYSVGVAADSDSASLLRSVDEFVALFSGRQQKERIDRAWLGRTYPADGRLPFDVLDAARVAALPPRSLDPEHQLVRSVDDLALHAAIAAGTIEAAASEVVQRVDQISEQLTRSAADVARCLQVSDEVDRRVQGQAQRSAEQLSAPVEELLAFLDQGSTSSRQVLDEIAGVARQLELLGLNAKIEAMRAGDSGHAFAVIADEVRMLAIEAAALTQRITSSLDTPGLRAQAEELQQATRTGFDALVDQLSSGVREALAGLDGAAADFDVARESLTQLVERAGALTARSRSVSSMLAPGPTAAGPAGQE